MASVEPMAAGAISDEDFRGLLAKRGRRLFSAATYLSENLAAGEALTRPMAGTLLSQSRQVEEFLDSYGAQHSTRWHPFRSIIAAIKLFSEVSYILLHIQHVLPSYRLLPIEKDFEAGTRKTLAFAGSVLLDVSRRMLELAKELGLHGVEPQPDEDTWAERLPPGRLVYDRANRRLEDVPKTVTALATAFLNLAAECDMVHVAGRARPEEYASHVPDPVSEKSLRYLQHRFHSLQALYDTYVYETETESLDPDLPVLRGHISVVFHLLETATAFAHYYERHANRPHSKGQPAEQRLVDPDALLVTLMNYSIAYASRYLACARNLCQSMLKYYAEVGRVDVSAPRYRGFHVRPATLVSKVVQHYGSEVYMEVEGERYDASTPFEIFRANEKINARKRRWLAQEVARISPKQINCDDADTAGVCRQIILRLAGEGKVVIYEQPLKMPPGDKPAPKEATLLEKVVNQIARLQATGKIDIETELNIVFLGDKRVLADIELLANCGYGEDNLGNNIPLPEALAYLRR